MRLQSIARTLALVLALGSASIVLTGCGGGGGGAAPAGGGGNGGGGGGGGGGNNASNDWDALVWDQDDWA